MSAVVGLIGLLVASAAPAQTFSNTTPIGIPTLGRANLYPSVITLSGAPINISTISVTLHNLTHSYPADLNVLLVSPAEQTTYLMANAGGSFAASDDTLTFTPDATETLPFGNTPWNSGVYACSVYFGPTNLPAPAPAGPYGTSFTPFIGTNPNGAWQLYVWDDFSGDGGSIAGGWSLKINDLPPAETVSSKFTYQGRLLIGNAPVIGDAIVRFTLCNNPSADTASCAVAPAVTRTFTGLTDGLITTTLDVGSALESAQARWLNVEVQSPPGSEFVTLSPRQAITPAPQASFALKAATALNAEIAQNAVNAASAQTAQQADFATLAASATNAASANFATSASSAVTATNATNAVTATNALNATNAANVASGGFSVGGLIGPGVFSGATPLDAANRGVKSRVGYATNPAGTLGFAGMQTTVLASPSGSGNTCDLTFETWDSSTGAREALRINGMGDVGIGTATPAARLHVTTGAVGSGWQTVWTNSAVLPFRGGLRLSDNGFLELTNSAGAVNPNFARLSSNGAWTAVSDARLKTDVSPMQHHLETLTRLKPVNFRWKASGEADFGLIAQDVRTVLPSLVLGDDATQSLTVNYSQLSVVAIGAIQELKAQNDAQRAQIDALNERLAALEAALTAKPSDK
jgi:subtilisin-like proprotein convertase family protein